MEELQKADYAIARINAIGRGRSFAGGSGSGSRIRASFMTAELPQTAQRCGREFEIVLQLTQYIAKGSGILQIGGSGVHSMTFPIEVHLLAASPLPFFFRFLVWRSGADPECPLFVCKPPNGKRSTLKFSMNASL